MNKSTCIQVIEIDAAIYELRLLLTVLQNADAETYINNRIIDLQTQKQNLK